MHAPAHLGPFVALQPIAAGGMGQVWRAVHRDSHVVVAVKTAAPGHEDALRREIAALRGLDHPGIAGLVAHGEAALGPWYAMRWVEGETLAERWATHRSASSTNRIADDTFAFDTLPATTDEREGSPILPEPTWRQRLAPLVQLAATLAWLHGEGLVHADVKPHNVILSSDGLPVLIDFGMLAHSGSTRVGELGVGGLARGGTPAYMSPEQKEGALLDARADTYALGVLIYEALTGAVPPPRPPPLHGAPRALRDLTHALLDPHPSNRLAHATDVAAALGALVACPSAWPGAPPNHPTLLRPVLLGRGEEVDALVAVLGAGQCRVLVGPSGVGRTRLALEVLRRYGRRGATWRAVAGGDRDSWARAFPGLDLDARPSQIAAAAYAGLLEEARVRPQLLWIDDLDRGGPFERELAIRIRVGGPEVRLLAGWCDDMGPPPSALASRAHPVHPLTRDDGLALVGELLGCTDQPLSGLGEALVARAEGLPRLLVEDLTTAVELGWLQRIDGHWRRQDRGLAAVRPDDLPPARSLAALASTRLASLPQATHLALCALAVLGERAGSDTLDAMVTEAGDALGPAVRAGLVEPRPGAFAFAHRQFRQIVLDACDPATRTRLHRQAGEILATADSPDAPAIANHLETGGAGPAATPWHRRAALALGARGESELALDHWTRWLEVVGDRADAFSLIEAANAALHVPAFDQAEALARRAQAAADQDSERAAATVVVADAVHQRSPQAAIRLLEAALADLEALDPRARVQAALGYEYAVTGDDRTAAIEAALRAAVARPTDMTDRGAATAWSTIGAMAYFAGRYADAADAWMVAVTHTDDATSVLKLMLNVAAAEMENGQAEKSRGRLRDLIPAIEARGTLGLLGTAELNLALIEHLLGRPHIARRLLERTVRRAELLDDAVTLSMARQGLCQVLAELYLLDAMERELAVLAADTSEEVRDRREPAILAHLRALYCRARQQHDRACAIATRWGPEADDAALHALSVQVWAEGALASLAIGQPVDPFVRPMRAAATHLTRTEREGTTYAGKAIAQVERALAARARGDTLSPWGWAWRDVPVTWEPTDK